MKAKLCVLALVFVAISLSGCSKGMVKASEIKPAVDLVVADYLKLIPENDPLKEDKVATANELKMTVDLAAGGGE